MLRSYFKIAWRNMVRNKVFSIINILGLAIGIAAALLILQYVAFELSYDRIHVKRDRIYRIDLDRYNNGKLGSQWAGGAFAAGNSFKNAFPEVEEYVKLVKKEPLMMEHGDNSLKVEKTYFATPAFFAVFSYPLRAGDPTTVLTEPNTVVLSESVARKLFGQEDPVGKSVRQNKSRDLKVTGIFKDLPVNTHLKADMLISYATFQNDVMPNDPEAAWDWDGCLSYLLLRPGTNAKALEAKFPAEVERATGDYFRKLNAGMVFSLRPLLDIHLYSHRMWEAEPNGNGNTVYLLLGIALFIIVIAWINYINLATARSINRAVEVGVRKSMGSRKSQLIKQFLLESVLLNALAVIAALAIVGIVTPLFNDLSGIQLSLSLLNNTIFWTALLALFLVGSFFSGLYPAFVLSGFKPVNVLKGKAISARQGSFLRKSLVVFQFAASLFLLAGSLTVFRQVQFMRTQELGINIDQTLVIRPPLVIQNDSLFGLQMKAFKEELLRESGIRFITTSTIVPGEPSPWNAGGIRLRGQDASAGTQYRIIGVDHDFVDTYEMKLLAGRNFSHEFGNDRRAVIFNKKAIQQLGFSDPQLAIGKEIEFWGDIYTIAGVVSDFHQESLREAYEPLILRLIPGLKGPVSIKMMPENTQKIISVAQQKWKTFFPENPFEYFFLDQHFNDQYQADQRFGKIFSIFTTLAILVACLGLFGLAAFTTVQRTKEISIRKVLGASVSEIVQLLYREFAILILIAFVIATPLSWYAAHRWLQNYAFHTDLYWWLFGLPLFVVLVIAFVTVSFQSVRAALMDPVKSLRSE